MVLLPDDKFLWIKLSISADGPNLKLHTCGERWNIPNMSFVMSLKHLPQHVFAYLWRYHKQKQFGPRWFCCHLGFDEPVKAPWFQSQVTTMFNLI